MTKLSDKIPNPKKAGYVEHKLGAQLRPRIKTRYDESDKVRLHSDSWSRTSVEYTDELDINNIVKRLMKGENLQNLERAVQYGDSTTVPEFHQALQVVAEGNAAFAELPAHIRERFQNDPKMFLEFIHDEKNVPEMERLGMFKAEAVERVKAQRAKDAEEVAELRKNAKKKPEPGTPGSGGQPKGGSGADEPS